MFLIDFQDQSDTAVPTVTIMTEGEVVGPDNLGGYAIDEIGQIYAAVTQRDTAANDRAFEVAEKLQNACWHGKLYLGGSWQITLVRETGRDS